MEDGTTEAAGMEVDGSDQAPLQINRANEAYVDSDTDEGSVDQDAGGDEEADGFLEGYGAFSRFNYLFPSFSSCVHRRHLFPSPAFL